MGLFREKNCGCGGTPFRGAACPQAGGGVRGRGAGAGQAPGPGARARRRRRRPVKEAGPGQAGARARPGPGRARWPGQVAGPGDPAGPGPARRIQRGSSADPARRRGGSGWGSGQGSLPGDMWPVARTRPGPGRKGPQTHHKEAGAVLDRRLFGRVWERCPLCGTECLKPLICDECAGRLLGEPVWEPGREPQRADSEGADGQETEL